jgi:hypothetical protein
MRCPRTTARGVLLLTLLVGVAGPLFAATPRTQPALATIKAMLGADGALSAALVQLG